MMAVAQNVVGDLKYVEINEYIAKAESVCNKLHKPVGGDVYVCNDTDEGKTFGTAVHVKYNLCRSCPCINSHKSKVYLAWSFQSLSKYATCYRQWSPR